MHKRTKGKKTDRRNLRKLKVSKNSQQLKRRPPLRKRRRRGIRLNASVKLLRLPSWWPPASTHSPTTTTCSEGPYNSKKCKCSTLTFACTSKMTLRNTACNGCTCALVFRYMISSGVLSRPTTTKNVRQQIQPTKLIMSLRSLSLFPLSQRHLPLHTL